MNGKRMFPALALMALLALTTGACVGYGYGPDLGVQVGFGPPGFRTEVALGNAPGPGYVWVPGYYDWAGDNYTWIQGSWILPPRPHASWVAPRYEHRRGGWYYRRGHWR